MTSAKWLHYILLLKRLAFIVLLFQISRFVFALLNPETYSGSFFSIFLAGLRYDLTSIFILNSLLIILHLFQGEFSFRNNFQRAVSFLVISINSLALLFNIIDSAWYSYIQKRSTADVFAFINAGGADVTNNLLQYVFDYWYLLLLWLLMVSSLLVFEKKMRIFVKAHAGFSSTLFSVPLRSFFFLFFGAISIIGFRGGIQLKPLSLQAAAKMVPSAAIPLVLNTPYTIIKSWNDQLLEEAHFMTNAAATQKFPIHRSMTPDSAFIPMNVVVIIMESFSFEHISYYHPKETITPFIDSLLTSTVSWPNTYANGKRSIEGIPAIIASLPAWMDQPFINSAYNVNKINSLASLLKPYGYTTGFFHGGNNGTMGFDNFSKLAGYDHYYGKNEYDGAATDYDGHWGIFDHAYFSFMVRRLNTWKEPFHAAFFSLSSHHPYKVPENFKKEINQHLSPLEQSMAYADAALKLFFADAKKQAWYNRTLFVICTDHSGPASSPYTMNRLGAYHIPLLFILPGSTKGQVHIETAQQSDILPSVLHLLNYTGEYSTFGRDLFSSNEGWSVNYSNNSWQLITDQYMLQFDGQESTHLFKRSDMLLQHNLIKKDPAVATKLETFLKAVLQQYRYSLIHNHLVK